MSVEPNPIILSFYQSTLLPIVNAVTFKWNAGDYVGAFSSVKLYYANLPSICKKDCKEDYEKSLRTVEAIRNGFKELDISTRYTKIGIVTRRFLYSEVLRLVELFHDSLDEHKYLEKAGVKPRYEKMAKL